METYDQREASYKARKALCHSVWAKVGISGMDVYQAFDHYVEALVVATQAHGQLSAEFILARQELQAFVEPWLERAS
jgi:hypothetical protein